MNLNFGAPRTSNLFVFWSLRGSPLRFLWASHPGDENFFCTGLFRPLFKFRGGFRHNFAPLSGAGGLFSSRRVRLGQARIHSHRTKYGFCGATVYSRLASNRENIW